jgi:peptide/nickel transport system substrate-binding protein
VAAQLLRQAGFKVDLQAMDWQTLVGRRAKKDAPDKGGWHMFLTAWGAFDVWNPISNPAMDTRGEKSTWFGWATDDKMVELAQPVHARHRRRRKKKLADQIHARAFEAGSVCASGRVRPADGCRQEHQWLLHHQRQPLLEPEEELMQQRPSWQ